MMVTRGKQISFFPALILYLQSIFVLFTKEHCKYLLAPMTTLRGEI